jgi:T-complex protein 1 subunit theta
MLDSSFGFNNLLKEVRISITQGHKHFSGFEEVVLKNINACKEISAKIKRSLGPFGNININV